MKRFIDVAVASAGLVLLAIPMLLVAIAVKLTSKGPALHWSERVGRNNQLFYMPKFRTMQLDAPQLATHLLTHSKSWLTPIGSPLRKTSVDELPQLWSVLVGEMSLVGPRPALFNQADLIEKRTALGIHQLPPGLTGWAQIHGRDELSIDEKVHLDQWYLDNQSTSLDIWILLKTVLKVVAREGVAQADEKSQTISTSVPAQPN